MELRTFKFHFLSRCVTETAAKTKGLSSSGIRGNPLRNTLWPCRPQASWHLPPLLGLRELAGGWGISAPGKTLFQGSRLAELTDKCWDGSKVRCCKLEIYLSAPFYFCPCCKGCWWGWSQEFLIKKVLWSHCSCSFTSWCSGANRSNSSNKVSLPAVCCDRTAVRHTTEWGYLHFTNNRK